MDLSITKVQPADLTSRDLYWLQRCCRRTHTGMQPKHIIKDAIDGKLTMWRIVAEDEVEGIAIFQINDIPSGRELVVWNIAGRGIIKALHPIKEATSQYAQANSCNFLRSEVTSPALADIYLKEFEGAKVVSYSMVMELDNG